MKILVTGGAGYIGSHTCVQLIQNGYEVVILDNLSNAKPEAVDAIAALTGKRPDFVQGDMRDAALLEDIFSTRRMDAVIHFAGLKAVAESTRKPLEYYETNIAGTLTLLRTMQAHACKRIVFSSSATVYGQENPAPFTETQPVGKATNPYGSTKIMIEQILTDLAASDPSFKVMLLRYFNPVGAHESGRLGESPNGIPQNLMPIIGEVALGKRTVLHVTGTDYDTADGTGARDYIHVQDLAAGHIKALDYTDKNPPGTHIFNLGTGKPTTVLELVRAFEKETEQHIPLEYAPRRPGDIAYCYADTKKANTLLGWYATRTVADMCRDTWRWLHRSAES
jgi:UDP-glucose 4-epimerase